jgi:DNA-binding NarL/FixJ family response regulator
MPLRRLGGPTALPASVATPRAWLERASGVTLGDDEWLARLHDEVGSMVGAEFGLYAASWLRRRDHSVVLKTVCADLDPPLGPFIDTLINENVAVFVEADCFVGELGELSPEFSRPFRTACGVLEVGAFFALTVRATRECGLIFVTPTCFEPVTPSWRRTLHQTADRLGVGRRLRFASEGMGTFASAIERLERSQGLERTDPAHVKALWKGLVAGRWMIVEWVQTPLRRYLVAFETKGARPAALSAREGEVAELLAEGRRTSELSEVLGVSAGTVSRVTREVLERLHVPRRDDVAAFFGTISPLELPSKRAEVRFFAAGSSATLWPRLTASERAVVMLVFDGASVAEVAHQRGSSVKTVSNQLSAVYSRFGVRGRTELAAVLGAPPNT